MKSRYVLILVVFLILITGCGSSKKYIGKYQSAEYNNYILELYDNNSCYYHSENIEYHDCTYNINNTTIRLQYSYDQPDYDRKEKKVTFSTVVRSTTFEIDNNNNLKDKGGHLLYKK